MSISTETRKDTTYTLREYRTGDETGFLNLYERIFYERRGIQWFDWKYKQNPYVEHVPLFVIEAEEGIVGTRGFQPFRLRVGESVVLGLLATDTMVHPDHRRRGLFTWMTTAALDHYSGTDPALIFNTPNDNSLRGYTKMGWRDLGPVETYYRFQTLRKPITERIDNATSRLLGSAATLAGKSYLRVREALGSDFGNYRVVRFETVPADYLLTLARRSECTAIHVEHDHEFYEWFFSNPLATSTTYLAFDGAEPVAGLVVQTQTEEGLVKTNVRDLVPIRGGQKWEAALSPLLSQVVRDHRDSDLLRITAPFFPAIDALAEYGFHSDAKLPLSYLKPPWNHFAVRTIGNDSWTINDLPLIDRDNWLVPRLEA